MMSIDKGIFEKTDFLFKSDENVEGKMPKLQHSCDGVLIIEQKEGKYIAFIELKCGIITPDIYGKAQSDSEKEIQTN